jgi:hypothetical protein
MTGRWLARDRVDLIPPSAVSKKSSSPFLAGTSPYRQGTLNPSRPENTTIPETNSDYLAEQRRAARKRWPSLPSSALHNLLVLIEKFNFSVEAGDLLWLDRGWYVTHTGLLSLASRRSCAGIEVHPVVELCDPKAARWVFSANVFPTRNSKGFSGFGDADPTNVSEAVRGAELRIAETRAVNRALRKAYGVGLCSVEELGSVVGPPENGQTRRPPARTGRALEVIAAPPLRDQLRQLIRQHQLDPARTKSYALAYLKLGSLSEASREQVGSLLTHLQQRLFENRDGFVSELASFTATTQQVGA